VPGHGALDTIPEVGRGDGRLLAQVVVSRARPALRPRQLLGKYRIERRIAQGGFAEVYRAQDTIEGVPVALKVPYPHLVDAALLADFRREVRLAAPLDHPNVLPIKNAQVVDGRFVIAYPLGAGTLADRMQRRLAAPKRVAYAAQMLAATAHAHAHRIIHCDLKPENFILFRGDRLRLADFGISRLSRRTLLASGSGTVGYVAPEQAMGFTSLRSDVFSLGLILWQLFSGELPEWPFRWPLPGLARLRRETHPHLVAFLRRALALEPHRRFADAQQMAAAFERLRARGQVRPAPQTRRRRRRREAPPDWGRLRQRQFVRAYGRRLQLDGECGRCKGPVSEAMRSCPWCGHALTRWRGETRHPARCGRCGRGRKPDWRYCPWCYGPAFRRVSARRYADRSYTEKCGNPRCERRVLLPFARYCPWCRRRPRRRFPLPGSEARCGRCGWGVHRDLFAFCPWCGQEQRRGRRQAEGRRASSRKRSRSRRGRGA
jgi:serine/threonine-protein kinase